MSKVLNNLITLVEEIHCDGNGGFNERNVTTKICARIGYCAECAFRKNTMVSRRAKIKFQEFINEYKDTSTDSIS